MSFRVGVILCFDVPEHKAWTQALRSVAEEQYDLGIEIIALDSEKAESAVRSRINQVLNRGYDALVVMGASLGVFAKKVLDEVGGFPCIFVGVRDPVKKGIVSTLEAPGNNTNGVSRTPLDNCAVIEKLLPVLKKRKGLLLPYVSWAEAGNMQQQVIDIKRFIASNSDVIVHAIPIENEHDAAATFERYLGRYDSALLLEGLPVTSAAYELSEFCWRNDILLCGYGLRFIDVGAACTMGGDYFPYGEAIFRLLKYFLIEQKGLGTVPYTMLPDNQCFVANVDMLRRVGLQDDEVETLCNQPGVEKVRRWRY